MRLYSGFRYADSTHTKSDPREWGLLLAEIELAKAAEALGEFSAESVDQGRLWEG